AARQLAQLRDEMKQLDWGGKRRVPARRNAIAARFNAPDARNFAGHFRARQPAAMARLCPLAELDLDHLDLRLAGGRGETLRRECAVMVAAAEITPADLPTVIGAV